MVSSKDNLSLEQISKSRKDNIPYVSELFLVSRGIMGRIRRSNRDVRDEKIISEKVV